MNDMDDMDDDDKETNKNSDSTPQKTPDKASKDKDLIKKAFSNVQGYHEATSDIREKRAEDFRFNFGDQWDQKDRESLAKKRRPILTFNVTSPVINFLAGYQQEREQDFRAYPRGTEDERIGRITTALMRFGMDQCRGIHTLHRGFRQGIIGGQAVFEVSHSFDYTDDLLEGDVSIELLEHDTWGHEPGARRYDRNDSSYQFKLYWVGVEDAARKWKKKASLIRASMKRDWLREDPTLTGVPQQLLEDFIDEENDRLRILQYWYRVPVEVALLVNLATGEVKRFDSEKKAETELRMIHDTAGAAVASQFMIMQADSQSALVHVETQQVAKTFIRPEQAQEALDALASQAGRAAAGEFELVVRPTTALRVANITAWEVLDDKPNPKGSDWRYPFAPFTVYQDTDDISDIKGLVRDIKDPQREVNWHHSTSLDTLQRGPKGGVWVQKGEHADIQKLREKISEPGFIGEYDGTPPVPVVPQMINEGEMAMLQFGMESIMRISNVNAEMMGQVTQKTVSGRAIQSRQAGGLVGIGSLFLNWKETKTLIGQLLIRCIQHYYSPEKMDRIIGQEQRKMKAIGLASPDEVPEQQMYETFKELKNSDVDIVVEFQDASPTARAAVSNQMLQLQAAGFPIPGQLIIEAADIPYKTEVLAAMANQGQGPPNPELAKALSAGQGQTSPNGVNTSQ